MYSQIRLCVRCNDKLTPFAPSNVVVQQGDSLSPTLLFINDLLSVLRNETDGATIIVFYLLMILFYSLIQNKEFRDH